MMAHQDTMMRSTYAKCWCRLPRQCDILVCLKILSGSRITTKLWQNGGAHFFLWHTVICSQPIFIVQTHSKSEPQLNVTVQFPQTGAFQPSFFKKRRSNTLQTQIIVIGTPSKHLQLSLCGDYTAHRIATGMQWNTCQWNSVGQSGVIEVYRQLVQYLLVPYRDFRSNTSSSSSSSSSRHDVHHCPWTPLSL
jgi:hypothetical protein